MTQKKRDSHLEETKEISGEVYASEDAIVYEQPSTEETSENLDALRQELEEARLKMSEYLDGWQRSRAEFSNYRKRIEREQAQTYQLAVGNVIKRYLDVADDLERALKNRPKDGEGAVWANGVELIYQKLLSFMDSEGVKPMEVEGQPFDPTIHEAISSENSDQHESGQVIEVVQQGYKLGDRVLRPAIVRVAR